MLVRLLDRSTSSVEYVPKLRCGGVGGGVDRAPGVGCGRTSQGTVRVLTVCAASSQAVQWRVGGGRAGGVLMKRRQLLSVFIPSLQTIDIIEV